MFVTFVRYICLTVKHNHGHCLADFGISVDAGRDIGQLLACFARSTHKLGWTTVVVLDKSSPRQLVGIGCYFGDFCLWGRVVASKLAIT